MSNNPYDDLLKNLARLIEQVTGLEQNMRHLNDMQAEKPHIIGCAIIAGNIPHDQEIPCRRGLEVQYEIVDAGEIAYLTVGIPATVTEHPGIEFTADSVIISASGSRAPVELGFRIVPESCSYSFINGVVDATLIKEQAAIAPAE